MPKYLCIAAVWVEGEDADDAADHVDHALRPVRVENTVGKITGYDVPQTFQDGFVIDLSRFDLEDVVTGIEPPEEKGQSLDNQ